jgi:hypothetical protein
MAAHCRLGRSPDLNWGLQVYNPLPLPLYFKHHWNTPIRNNKNFIIWSSKMMVIIILSTLILFHTGMVKWYQKLKFKIRDVCPLKFRIDVQSFRHWIVFNIGSIGCFAFRHWVVFYVHWVVFKIWSLKVQSFKVQLFEV